METTIDTTSFRRFTDLASLTGILSSKSLTLLDPTTWDDHNDAQYLAIYKNKLQLKSVLALCFSKEVETYHHWKTFARGSTGVCIVLKASILVESIADIPSVQGDNVQYLKLDNIRKVSLPVAGLPFSKRFGYQPENEYRLLYSSATDVRSSMSVPISIDCVRSVVLSPWLHISLVAPVTKMLTSIEGCEHLKVQQSTLTSNREWIQFGETAT